MVTRDEIERALGELGLDGASHVLVHASYKSFGGVEGGAAAVLEALVASLGTVMMPASTWRSMLPLPDWPEPGPGEEPVPFADDMPVAPALGVLPETFRSSFAVRRTSHPLQSFSVYGALADEIAAPRDDRNVGDPITRLLERGGHVLLIGVTHTSSTALHLSEWLAGRRLFLRRALTPSGVREVRCGGCSRAFDAVAPHVEHLERRGRAGASVLLAYELRPYVEAARALIARQPDALLCGCDRCETTLHTQAAPA